MQLLVKDCLVNFVSIAPRCDNFEAVRDYDGLSLEGDGAKNNSDKSNMWWLFKRIILSCCRERSFDTHVVSTGVVCVLSKRTTCSFVACSDIWVDLLVSHTMELGARAEDIRDSRIKQGLILPMLSSA